MSKIAQFYQLSSILTQHSLATLKAADPHSQYFKQLCHQVKPDTLEELFNFHHHLTHNHLNHSNLGQDSKPLIRRQIIASAKFGQIAVNIIRLWEGKS